LLSAETVPLDVPNGWPFIFTIAPLGGHLHGCLDHESGM
jgi:hypothetical protein